MTTTKTRLRSALSIDIDPHLLERVRKRADQERIGLRVAVEKAIALYLDNDGIPPGITSSIETITTDVAAIAAQLEPIAAFLAAVKYRTEIPASRRLRADGAEEP